MNFASATSSERATGASAPGSAGGLLEHVARNSLLNGLPPAEPGAGGVNVRGDCSSAGVVLVANPGVPLCR